MKNTSLYIGVGTAVAVAALAAGLAWFGGTAVESEPTQAAENRAKPPEMRSVANPLNRELAGKNAQGEPVRPPALATLKEAVALEEGLPYANRSRALQARFDRQGAEAEPLTVQEVALLMTFLENPAGPEGLSRSETNALKNDALNLLALQAPDKQALAELLRSIHADPKQDTVMRDYALQTLAGLEGTGNTGPYAQHWKLVEEAADPKRKIRSNQESLLAATSLLHLMNAGLEGRLSSGKEAEVRHFALAMARNEKLTSSARLTALQVCGQLGVTDARALANELARSDQTAFTLRIAAVATLGDLTDANDKKTITYLEDLTNGRNIRLREPARVALKKIQARAGGGTKLARNAQP